MGSRSDLPSWAMGGILELMMRSTDRWRWAMLRAFRPRISSGSSRGEDEVGDDELQVGMEEIGAGPW